MSSIIRNGDTYHGISVFGRGVFTHEDEDVTMTYAGQYRDGCACGLGVLTRSDDGTKVYAEHGPDGQCDGRWLGRSADGDTSYGLCERGEDKDFAWVDADGHCEYNYVACAPDDPRVLALIAQVAPVEVRPAAPAPTRHSPATRPQAIVRWIGRLVLPSQALATTVATEVHPPRRTPSLVVARHNPTAAALQSTSTQGRVHGLFCGTGRTGGTLLHPNKRHPWCTPMGPSRQRRCHAIVQHAAC